MSTQVRYSILLLALAALPGLAAAQGSQAGDNGRQPLGSDNEGPRMAIPNQGAEAGYWSSEYGYGYYDPYRYYYVPRSYTYAYVAPPGVTYYSPPAVTYYSPPAVTYYSPPAVTYYPPPTVYYGGTYDAYNGTDRARALASCENLPLAQRPACRDAATYGGRY
jgi:hypothetical protein